MSEEVDQKQVINRTYIYLFPIIGLSNKMKKEDFKYFKAIYFKDENRADEKEKLYLLLRFKGDRTYAKFEEQLRRLPNCSDSYDPDSYHTMFVFDIPSEYKREYDLFCKGKYSQFSENYKQSIAVFHGYKGRKGEAALNVLYKKEQGYLDMEYYINEGLPEEEWTRIPRDQEIARLITEIIDGETYHLSDVIKESNNHQVIDDSN